MAQEVDLKKLVDFDIDRKVEQYQLLRERIHLIEIFHKYKSKHKTLGIENLYALKAASDGKLEEYLAFRSRFLPMSTFNQKNKSLKERQEFSGHYDELGLLTLLLVSKSCKLEKVSPTIKQWGSTGYLIGMSNMSSTTVSGCMNAMKKKRQGYLFESIQKDSDDKNGSILYIITETGKEEIDRLYQSFEGLDKKLKGESRTDVLEDVLGIAKDYDLFVKEMTKKVNDSGCVVSESWEKEKMLSKGLVAKLKTELHIPAANQEIALQVYREAFDNYCKQLSEPNKNKLIQELEDYEERLKPLKFNPDDGFY